MPRQRTQRGGTSIRRRPTGDRGDRPSCSTRRFGTSFKNEFSWSKSRDDVFRECPRKYYFQYYGSWGGWEIDSDPRVRALYTLKHLQTRHQWAGAAVHECITTAVANLRRGVEALDESAAIATTIGLMRLHYRDSRNGAYWRSPKWGGLLEHEYGQEIPNHEWKRVADHVAECLRVFYHSDVFEVVRTCAPVQILEVEEFSSFVLDGIKVNVRLDLGYRDAEGIIVYDWKTGTCDAGDHALQLACYASYAVRRWGVDVGRITTVEFNLATGELHEHHPGPSDLDALRQYALASAGDMQQLLDDPAANTASEERFALAENQDVCWSCTYRKECPRWQGK
jgi:hypothetical protein